MSIKLKMYGNQNTTNLHYLLYGLDEPDQHPIKAIIGLQEALDSKYVKPSNGIPSSDLEEKFVSEENLADLEALVNDLYAKCQISIENNSNRIDTNETNIDVNKTDIININTMLNDLKNKINTIPNEDSIVNGSACVRQEIFEVTDDNKTFTTTIVDTDLKVIHPTILKDGMLYNGQYTVQYPDDTTLSIEFVENGEYLINYIAGEVTESEYEVLTKYIKELEEKILKYSAGSILNPSCSIKCVYDDNNKLIQEIYTGDVNKTVSYSYDNNDNIIKKVVVQDDTIKAAYYMYDSNNNIIQIIDEGVDIPLDETRAKKYTLNITYDNNGNVIKEEYTGDINKIVEYTYNVHQDVLTKSVTEGATTKTATYIYDSNRKLIRIEDEGTDKIAVVFPSEIYSSGGGSSTDPTEEITKIDVDLVFENIFKELI